MRRYRTLIILSVLTLLFFQFFVRSGEAEKAKQLGMFTRSSPTSQVEALRSSNVSPEVIATDVTGLTPLPDGSLNAFAVHTDNQARMVEIAIQPDEASIDLS